MSDHAKSYTACRWGGRRWEVDANTPTPYLQDAPVVLVSPSLGDGPTCAGRWDKDIQDPPDPDVWVWVSPTPLGWVVDDTGERVAGLELDAIRLWWGVMPDGRQVPLACVRLA
mgnify:CR=1 FL=1